MHGEISPFDIIGGFLHLLCETVASFWFSMLCHDIFGLGSGLESSEEDTEVGMDGGEQEAEGGSSVGVQVHGVCGDKGWDGSCG
jgi:hypothetical protein